MAWDKLHAALLSRALERLLGPGEDGAIAFIRCFPPEIVEAAAGDQSFAPRGWTVHRVADEDDSASRTITADRAVALREDKGPAMLLLVDTERAGAGMDGVYSAAREISEKELFDQAFSVAYKELEDRISQECRNQAEQVIKKARGWRGQKALAPWVMFDFLVQIILQSRYLGELIHLVGLWPVAEDQRRPLGELLSISQGLVDELLRGHPRSALAERLGMLGLEATPEQLADLQRFLAESAGKPLLDALADLEHYPSLRINALKVIDRGTEVHSLEIVPWRGNKGQLLKWSGLTEKSDPPGGLPELLIPPEDSSQPAPTLEVRWRVKPSLEKNRAQYRVTVCTDLGDELAVREVLHSGPRDQKCRFAAEELGLEEETVLTAHVKVEVIDQPEKSDQTEDFEIRFGEPVIGPGGTAGKRVRTLSEAIIQLSDAEEASNIAQDRKERQTIREGCVALRLSGSKPTTYRVAYPALIRQTDQAWATEKSPLGRWRLVIRGEGVWTGEPEFVPFVLPESAGQDLQSLWERATKATRELARLFGQFGGVGMIYDRESNFFENVIREYLLAWERLLSHPDSNPEWALAQTVEVRTITDRLVGLIVLPGHPVRVAWHAGYDNLAFYARFTEEMSPKDVLQELKFVDGAMFPVFLPGLEPGSTFVFADTLGFHAVAMVSDRVKEPKSAVALLAQALDNAKTVESPPTVGQQSAEIIGEEILKYLKSHDTAQPLRVHALQAGDGRTIAQALRRVLQSTSGESEEEGREENGRDLRFVLELFPSEGQRTLGGSFFSQIRERRRKGAGNLSSEDRWMLDSVLLPGQLVRPRLRWARKEGRPTSPAHLAVAFDLFESSVNFHPEKEERPTTSYGLVNYFVRRFQMQPFPHWVSFVPDFKGGQKHPADRMLTERLLDLLAAVHRCAARHLGTADGQLILHTEISPEQADNLNQLHRQCDWVITLDRHAGIEYFDSPRDNPVVYEAYVIDCVPEREDLGCLQMITSTSNLAEVRHLLDQVFALMGLSSSRRNAEFILKNLKALSGRLAIRLTGHKTPAAELVALALSYDYCRKVGPSDPCWLSLRDGFFIPVDDVCDLLPPLENHTRGQDESAEFPEESKAVSRPDLIYVSYAPRKGLCFQFVEVKYRRDLSGVRRVELWDRVRGQVMSLRDRWAEFYCHEESPTVRALRYAKLARVLRFYADKARRHADDAEGMGLSEDAYSALVNEIDRMVEKAADYTINVEEMSHRGWIFCPEYHHRKPELLDSQDGVEIYLFGPATLPEGTMALATASPEDLVTVPSSQPETSGEATSSNGKESSGKDGTPPGPEEVCVHLGKRCGTEQDVLWRPTIRGNPHLMIVGLPGMGKTNVLVNICAQLHRQGIIPVIFSYHSDLEERLEKLGCRLYTVDYDRLGINPLSVLDCENPKAYLDVAGAVRDIFLAIFSDLGDVQGAAIREAIVKSYEEKGWQNADSDAHPEVPSFARFYQILQRKEKTGQGFSHLLGRLKELSDYGFFETGTETFDVWTSDRPIAVRLHRTQNDTLQRAMAMLIFYDLYKGMFRRGTQNRITHVVVFDEAHRASRLRLLPTMAKECRKFGISLLVASQEARDFDTSLFSAIANYLVLRVNAQDAKVLARNTSTSNQEKQLLDKMKQLPKYQAIYIAEGLPKPVQVILDEAKS